MLTRVSSSQYSTKHCTLSVSISQVFYSIDNGRSLLQLVVRGSTLGKCDWLLKDNII